MVNDGERREAARRLRGDLEDAGSNGYYCSDSETVRYICDILGLRCSRCPHPWAGLEVLADLIEPGNHIGDSDKMVDRDALLALAEELEEDACWEVQSPGVDNRAWMLKDVCDRIREALGKGES